MSVLRQVRVIYIQQNPSLCFYHDTEKNEYFVHVSVLAGRLMFAYKPIRAQSRCIYELAAN